MYDKNNNHKNNKALTVEMLNVKHELCPEIPSDIFMEKTKKQCSLRNLPHFIAPHANSAYHGAKPVTDLGPKIWNTVPEETKQKGSLNSFKESIKMCVSIDYPCRV